MTKPKFDDMGKLLDALGDGYRYTEIEDDELITPSALDQYDVLFLTCNGWPAQWGSTTSDSSARPGLSAGHMRPEIIKRIKRNLSGFVERGGTLYVSDLRYEFLFYAFPDRIPGPTST